MKHNMIILVVLALVLFLSACKKEDTIEANATYDVTFTFKWDSTNFPTDYPGNAHFSSIVGWSHKSSDTMLLVNSYASEGIEEMAEKGATAILKAEIDSKISNGEAYQVLVGDNLGSGTGTISFTLEVTKDYPAVSAVTMLAPSPDWYVAAKNVNLFENNSFIESKTLEVFVYDSGTDDGTTFTSANANSQPQKQISLITDPPLGNSIALKSTIATATFKKR